MALKMTRRSAMTGLAGMAAAAVMAPHVARAAARTVKFGHNQTATSHYGQGSAAFAQAVAADPVLSGAVTIKVSGNAELGDELSMLKACSTGSIDAMICSNSVIGNVVPEFGFLNAPFLFKSVATGREVLDGPVGAEFATIASGKGLFLAAWAENGMRHVTSNRPVRTPADIQGMKIRVPQSQVMMNGFLALGAAAAPLNYSMLSEALRTGQFEAQENPIVVIEAGKFAEFQNYLSLTSHIYDPAALFASADLMEDLTEPQRAAFVACAKKAALVIRQVASSAQQDGIARLRSAGMTIVDDVDVAAFQKASRPYLDGLSGSFAMMPRLISAGA